MSNKVDIKAGDKIILRDFYNRILIYSFCIDETIIRGKFSENFCEVISFTKDGNLEIEKNQKYINFSNNYYKTRQDIEILTLDFLKDEYPEFFI